MRNRDICLVIMLILVLSACREKSLPDYIKVGGDIVCSGDDNRVKIDVNSNREWSAISPQEWILFPYYEREVGTTTLTIRVKENSSEQQREGSIEFTAGDARTTIKVLQREKSILLIANSSINLDYKPDTITIVAQSNVAMRVKVEQGEGWIESISTKAITESIYQFVIAENLDSTQRQGVISFTDLVDNKSVHVYIYQQSKPSVVALSFRGTELKPITIRTGSKLPIQVDWGDGTNYSYYGETEAHHYRESGTYGVTISIIEPLGVGFTSLDGVECIDLSQL